MFAPASAFSRALSLLVVLLVAMNLAAALVSLAAPEYAAADVRLAPASQSVLTEPTAAQARQALIEMLEQEPAPSDTAVARINNLALERLRKGEGVDFFTDEHAYGEDWIFNCNLKQRTFSFHTQPFRPALISFDSNGEFALKDGRWTAGGFHYRWLACFQRAERRRTGKIPK
jgi:hypothetical protein